MKNSTPTIHNSAKNGDFAKTVLMPGDPLRAKFIAENFMQNAKLVTDVRGILGYTGEYNQKPVSVMASGMGVPSMGIYSYELFSFYDVEQIIRIGSCGAISDKLNILDVVISQAVSTNSNYAAQFNFPGTLAPVGDFSLILKAYNIAKERSIPLHIGQTFCADEFYHTDQQLISLQKMGVLAVEMETMALYTNAIITGKKALSMFSVADSPLTDPVGISPKEREIGFNNMIELALLVATN